MTSSISLQTSLCCPVESPRNIDIVSKQLLFSRPPSPQTSSASPNDPKSVRDQSRDTQKWIASLPDPGYASIDADDAPSSPDLSVGDHMNNIMCPSSPVVDMPSEQPRNDADDMEDIVEDLNRLSFFD